MITSDPSNPSPSPEKTSSPKVESKEDFLLRMKQKVGQVAGGKMASPDTLSSTSEYELDSDKKNADHASGTPVSKDEVEVPAKNG